MSEQALRAGESLTLSFADAAGRLCGQARVTRAEGEGPVTALLAVFAAGEPIVVANTSLALEAEPGGGSWALRFAGGESGQGAFSVRLTASGDRLHLGSEDDRAFEQPCRATGEVTVCGSPQELDGPGQVGRAGAAERPAVERELEAWMEDGAVIALRAARPAGAEDHAHEQVEAVLADGEPDAEPGIDEARLSTTYDATGAQRRAGLELWPSEDSDYPRRVAGEVICHATLTASDDGDAAAVRWDLAFMDWRMDGQRGVGPYSILRRGGG